MTFAYGEPVVFIRAGLVDSDYSGGQSRSDWENPEVMSEPLRAAVAPGNSTEAPGLDRNPVDCDLDLLFEGSVDVDRSWRARLRGVQWDVVGLPEQYRNPWTGWGGTVVKVKRRDG